MRAGIVTTAAALVAALFLAQRQAAAESGLPGFRTDLENRSIDLSELRAGGPPKDGIPAIDEPRYVDTEEARLWLGSREPVIALEIEGEARAYPVQILTWHEIVNDRLGGRDVAVTFCPLCHSAVVFDREIDGLVHTFGVSGLLRNRDMVMYDRRTETLWQQVTGEAIVGDLTGTRLDRLPAQIITFAEFARAYGDATVLSRETGHRRDYGQNPYAWLDSPVAGVWLEPGDPPGRLPAGELVVTVSVAGVDRAYPHTMTRRLGAVNDVVGGRPIAIFHSSATDSTGVFDRRLEGRELRFRTAEGRVVDEQTGSVWDVTGRAVGGEFEGKRLELVDHGDYFVHAWFAFKPDTEVFRAERPGEPAP